MLWLDKWCVPRLAAGQTSQYSLEGEIMRRRFSMRDVFGRRLRCEVLEDRRLLSGVTLVTHGFSLDTTFPGWVNEMANEIAKEAGTPGTDVTLYRMEVFDLPSGQSSFEKEWGPGLDSSTTGEIVISLDWSDVANHTVTPLFPADLVASQVLPFLLQDNQATGISHPLAELPIHLIGHSRGGSAVVELAELLGEQGIWVDHVTPIDPHPLTYPDAGVYLGVPGFPDSIPIARLAPPDPPIELSSNIRFADNYWRRDPWWNPLNSFDFDGQSVDGAFDRQLSESVLGGPPWSDPGYGSEHSDAHLWYHGTIDTTGPIDDGTEWVPEDAGWYEGNMGPREEIGFAYSRIRGGYRPLSGLARYGAPRESVSLGVTGANVWDNAEILNLPNDIQVGQGEYIGLSIAFEDRNDDATITVGYDSNGNPYDGMIGANQQSWSTALLDDSLSLALGTSNMALDDYQIFVKIDNGTHTRYYYAPGEVTIQAGDPDATAIDVSVSASSTNVATGDEIRVYGEAFFNNGNPVQAATATITFAGQVWTAPVYQSQYEQYITIPSTASSSYLTVVVTDTGPQGLSGSAQHYMNVDTSQFHIGDIWSALVSDYGTRPRDDSTDIDWYTELWSETHQSYAVSPTHSGEFWGLLHLENISDSGTISVEVRRPNGSVLGEYDWYNLNYGSGSWWWAPYGWNDAPTLITEGVWTYDWYYQPDSGSKGKIATDQFVYRYDFTEKRMSRDVQSSDPYMPIGETSIFYQDDARALTWANFDMVSESLNVTWKFFEPNGNLYDTPPTHTTDPPPTDGYYDWYRTWGWIEIDGNNAAQKTGDWRVEVFVEDTNGVDEYIYTDYFQILERPGQAPTVDISLTNPNPSEGDVVSLDLTVQDNTYLDTVTLYWNDGTEHSVSWGDATPLFAGSFSNTVSLGTLAGGSPIEYWAVASETSGNTTSTARQSFGVRPLGPSNLTATLQSMNRVALSWNDQSSIENGFLIEREANGTGDWTQIALVGTNATTYEDIGLSPETTYSYRVRAHNMTGDSPWSAEAQATTMPLIPGDANQDWQVNSDDATIVASNWQMQTGATWSDGDFNGNGRVDDIDATIMAANFTNFTRYVVDSLADVVAVDGVVTLREALEASNTNTAIGDAMAGSSLETDVITFDISLFDSGPGVITLDGTQLEIAGDVDIQGPGAELLSIDANQQSRVFYIDANVTAMIDGLTITGGSAQDIDPNDWKDEEGGGIDNYGDLTLTNSMLSYNSAAYGGGGVFNYGTMTVTNSTFSGNSVSDRGGGINNFGGTLTITNSTLSSNSASRYGGGIYNHLDGTLTVTNSTLSGNVVSGTGSATGGGGIYNRNTLTVTNSILSLNVATNDPDYYGTLAPQSSNNLIGTDPLFVRNPSDGGDGWGDDPATPGIDESANDDYGDLRLTLGSPAIDAGSNALAVDPDGNPLLTDILDNPRIQDGTVDIGAYEYAAAASMSIQIIPGDANYSGTIDQADATIVATNWQMQTGATWAHGDFNNDGQVDDINATLMAANWTPMVTAGSSASSASVAMAPDAIYGTGEFFVGATSSPYDLDNDGQIGLGDLAFFASVYREKPGITTESVHAYAADFDGSGTVDLGDLALFAAKYRHGRPSASTILPGDANLDGIVDNADASTLARNWQKQTSATWAEGDFNSDGLVDDLDAAILARHWMMTVEDLDDDDARDSIFATIGATDDALGLYDE